MRSSRPAPSRIAFQPSEEPTVHFKHLYDLCRKAVMAWVDDYAPSMGAAISYYTIFSLAPLLVIVIAVAGAIFGRDAVQEQIVGQIGGLVGDDLKRLRSAYRAARDGLPEAARVP